MNDDLDGTLEEWRDIAQKLAVTASEATKEIKELINNLRTISNQRDKLFELCRQQHDLLVEHGIIENDEMEMMQ